MQQSPFSVMANALLITMFALLITIFVKVIAVLQVTADLLWLLNQRWFCKHCCCFSASWVKMLQQQTWTRKVYLLGLRPCLWLKRWMVRLCRTVLLSSMLMGLFALFSSLTQLHTVRCTHTLFHRSSHVVAETAFCAALYVYIFISPRGSISKQYNKNKKRKISSSP